MTTNKYLDKHVIRIGLICGLIGGGLMVYLGIADFGLGYIHGYLFFINYLLTMFVGLAAYKNLEKKNTTYLKRLSVGLLIYSVTTICFIIYSYFFGKYNTERTFQDKLSVPLILIAFGLFLSSLLALCFKTRQSWK